MIDYTKSKYSPKVRKFLKKDPLDFKPFTLIDGSVRSAKTVSIIFKMPQIMDALGNDALYCFSGYSKNTVRNNVLVELLPYLKNYHNAGIKYNSSSGELDIKLWGKLYNCLVVGGGNAGSEATIQGGTWKFWYANELSKHHYSFYNMALSRLSADDARAFADSNPESTNHWLYKEKIKPLIDTAHTDHDQVKQVFEYWHFIMDDNANLKPEYIEAQKRLYSGAFYERKILGQWRIAEGLVYDTFSDEKHTITHTEIIKKIQAKEFIEYIVGIDWGYTEPTAVVLIGVTQQGTYYLIDEFYQSKVQPENVIDWLKNKQFEYNIPVIRYTNGDNARPECNDKVRKAGYTVYEEKPKVEDSITIVRSIINFDRLIISDKCVNTSNEIQTYRYPSEDERLKHSVDPEKPIGENDHLMDSMRYILNLYERRFGRKLFEAYSKKKAA
ncbi:MAG: Phage-related protein [Candidatus Pacebacteria bacterium GW2011_GWF1_36_5]|nr:MAG: Phage-related protein [Candidatus Pacebacteria bacterium GW2011_GWF1_36_5]